MTEQPSAPVGMDFARQLHAEVAATNRDLYTRAQTVLMVNGLVISVLGAVVSTSPEDLAITVRRAGDLTGWLAMVAIVFLAASVAASFMALYSRHRSGTMPASGGRISHRQLWFYARIAEVPAADFINAAGKVDDFEEARIRLEQVAVMAPIIRRRADWVNAAYAASSLAFIAFVLAIVSYLISFR